MPLPYFHSLFTSAVYAKELQKSPVISTFVENKVTINSGTAKVVQSYLRTFQQFVFETYGKKTVDELIDELQKDQAANHASGRVYDVLSRFVKWQIAANEKAARPISTRVIRYKTKCVKDFLEYNDLLIIPSRFRLKVSLPRSIDKAKQPLDKATITRILLSAENIKHRAYLHFLAVTGCRAEEALSVTIVDLDLERKPRPQVFINGEYAKTKRDRVVYITKELAVTLNQWLQYKYRPRQVRLAQNGGAPPRWVENYKPEMKKSDRVFQVIHHNGSTPSLKHMYDDYREYFAKLLDRIGYDGREAGGRRRKITLHSFRRFVKTTISDLGYSDFSEFHIGHANSRYWTESERVKAELFAKIEPYLTFLDVESMEAKGADNKTRIDQLQADLQKERMERERLYELLYKQGVIKKE